MFYILLVLLTFYINQINESTAVTMYGNLATYAKVFKTSRKAEVSLFN